MSKNTQAKYLFVKHTGGRATNTVLGALHFRLMWIEAGGSRNVVLWNLYFIFVTGLFVQQSINLELKSFEMIETL